MICEARRKIRVADIPSNAGAVIWIAGRRIALDWTPCNFGGERVWFLCPDCDRRCGVLYPDTCRTCARLHYASEHEGTLDRRLRRAIRFRERYGQTTGGIVAPFPPKPKWVRWHTYMKARKRGAELDQAAWAISWARLPDLIRNSQSSIAD